MKSKAMPENQIRRYRLKVHLKLKEIATLMGHQTVAHASHFEKGRKLPSLANALKLSSILGCPVEILFCDLFNELRRDIINKKQAYGIKEEHY